MPRPGYRLCNVRLDDTAAREPFAHAQMTAPAQQPEFDEYTLMVSGRKRVLVDGETVEIAAGESLLVRAGARVQYTNTFDEPAVYWSVCIPAFSPETVHREA